MKKFAFGFACVLAGCAAGAAMPHVTAQIAPNPAAPRWQHTCVPLESGRSAAVARQAEEIAMAKGAEGWEFAGSIVDSLATVVCFKRPAP